MSESFSTGPLKFLTEADVDFNVTLELDEVERIILYSRNVFEFISKLCNVKRLKFSIGKMVVRDSTFSALPIKFRNLTELELAGDWHLISSFLENADNLQVLELCMVNDDHEYWMEPHQVPTSLYHHIFELLQFLNSAVEMTSLN